MTNDDKAREAAKGLTQGYIGPDHKVTHEGALFGSGAGAEGVEEMPMPLTSPGHVVGSVADHRIRRPPPLVIRFT